MRPGLESESSPCPTPGVRGQVYTARDFWVMTAEDQSDDWSHDYEEWAKDSPVLAELGRVLLAQDLEVRVRIRGSLPDRRWQVGNERTRESACSRPKAQCNGGFVTDQPRWV